MITALLVLLCGSSLEDWESIRLRKWGWICWARAVGGKCHNIRQGVRGRPTNGKSDLLMRNIFRTGMPTNFKLSIRMELEDPINQKRSDLQGQRSRSQSYLVRLTGVGPWVDNEKTEIPKLVRNVVQIYVSHRLFAECGVLKNFRGLCGSRIRTRTEGSITRKRTRI